MTLTRHFMGCVEGETETAMFSSLAKLLEVGFVQQWSRNAGTDEQFRRYSVSRSREQDLLMAEFDGAKGHTWWVIGYLSKGAADVLGLPNINMSDRAESKASPG